MVFDIDDKITFEHSRHKDETIRQVLRYDSGFIKDSILKNDRFVLSEKCYEEACRLTKGMWDNWEKPEKVNINNVFDSLKLYASPYQYDLNDEKLREVNQKKLEKIKSEL